MKHLALCAMMLTVPAYAQDDPISSVDFLVDWPEMVGERVRISGAVVYGFSQTYGTVKLSDQYFGVVEPWRDRDDLRFLFRNCSKLIPDERCEMPVVGTVQKDITGRLQLTDVDFEVPD